MLSDGGTGTLSVNANGPFTFPTPLSQGSSYEATIATQPSAQACTVTNGSGTVTSNVTNISVTCAPAPGYAYVLDNIHNWISQFSIGTNGALTPLSPATVPTDNSPFSVTVDPGSHYVFVTNRQGGTISQYVIQSDGTLMPNSPATVAASGPSALVFDSSGKNAYVVSDSYDTVSRYTLATGGQLHASADSPQQLGVAASGVAITPGDSYLYVTNYGLEPGVAGTMSQFAISSQGILSPLSPPTAPTDPNPTGIAIDATGRYVYVTNQDEGEVSQYSIGTAGALMNLTPATVPAGNRPWAVAIEPANRYVYVANFNVQAPYGTVSSYSIAEGGLLSPLGNTTLTECAGNFAIAFDPIGPYMYVACMGPIVATSGTVDEFQIQPDGSLKSLGSVSAPGTGTTAIAIAYVRP
jgi:6-phosphogluconolactonase (cycloisomerase 2 family)